MGFVVVVAVKNVMLKFRLFLTQQTFGICCCRNQVEGSSGNGIQPFLSIFVFKRELMLDS
jgi:hypothetical protein